MRTCIQCGRELKDGANFCPACGAQQTAEGPQTDKWGVPQPSGASKNAPAQQRSQFQSSAPETPAPTPVPPVVPDVSFVPDAPAKKRGLKWWYIVVPVLVAALAAFGAYTHRAAQPYREMVSFYEDDTTERETYDDDGHVLGAKGYDEDGELQYEEEYRDTMAAKSVNTLDVELIPGVETVECREVFSRDGEGESLKSEGLFLVIGYDKNDTLRAAQLLFDDGDRMLCVWTKEFENDSHGNTVKTTRTLGSGEVLDESTFDNTYSFGRLVESEVHVEQNGSIDYEDGQFVLGSLDSVEPTQDYRIEYRY